MPTRRFPPPGTKRHMLALMRSDGDGFLGTSSPFKLRVHEAIAELFYLRVEAPATWPLAGLTKCKRLQTEHVTAS
jgi:hypothetical protein